MTEYHIDQLIDHMVHKEVDKRRRKEEEVEEQRARIMRRIGDAAIAFLDLKDKANEDLVRGRIEEAGKSRMSKANAIATLAESGDFRSQPWWWDIRVPGSKQSLWKGYVLKDRVIRKRIQDDNSNTYLDVNVRKRVEDGFVAEIYGGQAAAVGIDDESPVEAIRHGYEAFKNTSVGRTTQGYFDRHVTDLIQKGA